MRASAMSGAARETPAERIVVEAGGERILLYPSPDADDQFLKLADAVAAVRSSRPVVCGPEAASAQTLCANGVLESVGENPDGAGGHSPSRGRARSLLDRGTG